MESDSRACMAFCSLWLCAWRYEVLNLLSASVVSTIFMYRCKKKIEGMLTIFITKKKNKSTNVVLDFEESMPDIRKRMLITLIGS